MSNYRPKIPQKPLVVCVGFLGSKPRHVQKYADLFSSIEVNVAPLTSDKALLTTPDVIQYIPPLETFTSSNKIKQSAEALGTMIEQQLAVPRPITPPKGKWLFPWQTEPFYSPSSVINNLDNYQPRKIVFLCLSNNGAFGYANMLNFLKKEKRQLYHKINSQTAGVIWDSSPSHPTPDVFQRGFVSAVGTLIGRKPQPHDPVLTPIFSGVISYLLKSKAYTEAAKEVTDSLEYSVPYHAPQLYLITEKDDLVLPEATREYVANRAKRVNCFFNKYPNHHALAQVAMGIASHKKQRSFDEGMAGFSIPLTQDNVKLVSNGQQIEFQSLDDINTLKNIANDTMKSSNIDLDWVDKHQAEFGLEYNYHQHVFPHYNIEELPQGGQYKINNNNNNNNSNNNNNYENNDDNSPGSSKNNNINSTTYTFHNDHTKHNVSELHSHIHNKLDLMRLPSLVSHIKHNKDKTKLLLHEQQHQNGSTISSNQSQIDPSQYEPSYLSHIEYCPHSHHIDVLFNPKRKSQLELFQFDPKVKPLFEKTERFDGVNNTTTTSSSPFSNKNSTSDDSDGKKQENDFHHFLFDFKESAHVQHIRKHPEQYRELVDAFCNYAFRG